LGDGLQNAGTVFEDVVIPEAQDPPAPCPQRLIASVMVTRAGVLATIDLDRQTRLDAREIHNIRRDRELPSKAPAESGTAQLAPQQPLGMGHILAQPVSLAAHRQAAAHVRATP
jgi:hypothetical protein